MKSWPLMSYNIVQFIFSVTERDEIWIKRRWIVDNLESHHCYKTAVVFVVLTVHMRRPIIASYL